MFNKNYRDGVKELQKDKKKKTSLIKKFKRIIRVKWMIRDFEIEYLKKINLFSKI